MKRLHLTASPDLKEYLTQALKRNGFELTQQYPDADLLLFAHPGGDLDGLDRWNRETEPNKKKWICMPALPTRVRRRLGTRVRILVPESPNPEQFRIRILGELFVQAVKTDRQLVGKSEVMARLREDMDRFAPGDEPVLLWGESGAGKELCAQYLHERRGLGKQVSVNCASLKPEMVESELFGHRRGAFTGASESRRGLFLEAEQGTCFLDEIGELDATAQASLLRVIEDRKVRSVGGGPVQEMRCRLVLATHRNLRKEVAAGRFRADLFHRISHLMISLPNLRERMEDLPLLVAHFVADFNRRKGTSLTLPKSFDIFFTYTWPGNVRELRGVIQRAAMRGAEGPLNLDSVKEAVMRAGREEPEADGAIPFYPGRDTWTDLKYRARKVFLEDALVRSGGINVSLEQMLDLGRSQIYKELKRHDIRVSR